MTSHTRKTFARYALVACTVLIGNHSFAAQPEDFQQQVRQSILGVARDGTFSQSPVTTSRPTTGAQGVDFQQQVRQFMSGEPTTRHATAAVAIQASNRVSSHSSIEGSVRNMLAGKGE
jgi:hypothetical protein